MFREHEQIEYWVSDAWTQALQGYPRGRCGVSRTGPYNPQILSIMLMILQGSLAFGNSKFEGGH